jgi:DNA-directed RNA polymerase subunit F
MLKQTVSYIDYNNEPVTETLYFNISKAELADNLHLQKRFEELESMFRGERRNLTPDEVREILDLVKLFIQLSYGVRSEDGKQFRKRGVFEDFQDSAAYDEFLFSLFSDPEKAVAFLLGVLPNDLREAAEEMVKKNDADFKAIIEDVQDISAEEPKEIGTTVEDNRPQWLKDGREPTNAELMDSPREYLIEAVRLRVHNQS